MDSNKVAILQNNTKTVVQMEGKGLVFLQESTTMPAALPAAPPAGPPAALPAIPRG